MQDQILGADEPINSLIGEDSEFKGEFKTRGVLRIDGVFRGEIDTEGKILVGKTGRIQTDIRANVVVIGGQVEGNIYAKKKVVLLSTGSLKGNIISPSVVIEEGAVFEGHCHINIDFPSRTGQ